MKYQKFSVTSNLVVVVVVVVVFSLFSFAFDGNGWEKMLGMVHVW